MYVDIIFSYAIMSNMGNRNVKKPNIQKDILKILSERQAMPLQHLKMHGISKKYAFNRSIKNLIDSGYAEIHNSDNQCYIKITKKGKNKLDCMRLDGEDALVANLWDGYWRIVILDIPEKRKSERGALRYLLKKANFVCIKNTVWISLFPYENLFTSIKRDLGLGSELMIIVTNKLDEDTRVQFMREVSK